MTTQTVDAAEIAALADRCETASAPDRLLDAIIWLHLPEQEGHAWKHNGDRFAHAAQIEGCAFIPSYTASLDAAMTLVPEGTGWCVSVNGKVFGETIRPQAHVMSESSKFLSAATPALALCAAALRAQAHLLQQERSA